MYIMADGVHVDCIRENRKDHDPMYDMGVEEPIGESNTEDTVEDQGFNSHALEKVIRPLYRGARCTQLVASILFMNLCTVHEATNGFSNEIFTILNAHLLPKWNVSLKNYCAVRSLIAKLGLSYNSI
jgi:hypothetical protein